MTLSTPNAGLGDPLRRLRNTTKHVAKVEIQVPPGDTLEVSDEVAAQLKKNPQIVDHDSPRKPYVPPVEDEDVKPAKKATAKKQAAKKAAAVKPVEDG